MIDGVIAILRVRPAVGTGVLGKEEKAQPRLVGGGDADLAGMRIWRGCVAIMPPDYRPRVTGRLHWRCSGITALGQNDDGSVTHL